MLIDSHCHLEEYYESGGEGPALEGLDYALAIAEPKEIPGILGVMERQPNVFASIGIHPHNVKDYDGIGYEKYLDNPRVVAIGEIGLDYHYDLSPREKQREMFALQIALAQKHSLPFIIHTREAEDDTAAIVREAGYNNGLFHCFSSSRKLWEFAMGQGFYVSFSGMLTFNKAQGIRDMAKETPLDKILIETDSPYLAPVPFRGKKNEPRNVKYVAMKLAEIKGMTYEEVLENTSRNFFTLFKKGKTA